MYEADLCVTLHSPLRIYKKKENYILTYIVKESFSQCKREGYGLCLSVALSSRFPQSEAEEPLNFFPVPNSSQLAETRKYLINGKIQATSKYPLPKLFFCA